MSRSDPPVIVGYHRGTLGNESTTTAPASTCTATVRIGKGGSFPWRRRMWAISPLGDEFVVLRVGPSALYTTPGAWCPTNQCQPLICPATTGEFLEALRERNQDPYIFAHYDYEALTWRVRGCLGSYVSAGPTEFAAIEAAWERR